MNNQLPAQINKYLKKFGYEKWKIEKSSPALFKAAVVIPAISEFDNLPVLLNSLSENDPKYFDQSIIIFVINNVTGADEKIINDNQKSISLIRDIIRRKTGSSATVDKAIKSGLNVALVDVSTGDFAMPEKDGGVGLARKIGMDLALTIFDYDKKGKNILLCTDADSQVSQNYLSATIEEFNNNNLNAGYVKFSHPVEGDSEQSCAIICYEIFLRYYVLGLKYARSPFAIHTIGSTMACDTEAYINIQGMNKKKAAEDFYFLEKLAKNYNVKYINSAVVYPSGRGSWRVPFGTGQRVNRYLSKVQDEYLLYSPECFDILKKWIAVFHSEKKYNADEYMREAELIHPSLKGFLVKQNFKRDWEKISQNAKTDIQLQKQKSFWFDGFKTLKLVHYLRDEVFPLVNMFDALDNLIPEFGKQTPTRGTAIPSLETQSDYLNILREIA